jgi:hypothetical protein
MLVLSGACAANRRINYWRWYYWINSRIKETYDYIILDTLCGTSVRRIRIILVLWMYTLYTRKTEDFSKKEMITLPNK